VSTLYNTFWVRFDHGQTSFANAIESSRMLFFAAQRAGVERIVHVSITNPSIESPLPYFRGKALVEYALAQTGVPYSIVRPTWVYGGERDVLANNIAWILRRMPAFAHPRNGSYPVQPVHIDDLARICVASATAARTWSSMPPDPRRSRSASGATMNWDLRHRKSSLVIRLLLAVWITVVVVVLCATGRWWGLVFVVPLVLDLYLLRRILAAGSGR
jgi:hypothetical protein